MFEDGKNMPARITKAIRTPKGDIPKDALGKFVFRSDQGTFLDIPGFGTMRFQTDEFEIIQTQILK